jgi:uncharacterized protein YggL (DUF469 family)
MLLTRRQQWSDNRALGETEDRKLAKIDYKHFIQLVTDKHKTRGAFCDDFGIARGTLYKWSRADGEVSEEVIEKLCQHFGVQRYVLDTTAREVDEELLADCIDSVMAACDDNGVTITSVSDQAYWAVQLYKAKAAGKFDEEMKKLNKVLTLNKQSKNGTED